MSKNAPAFAYFRTSSRANVEGDSAKRQNAATAAFAKQAGFNIVACFYDPAVSGADAIDIRPGFSSMLEAIEGNGVKTVIVEDTSRFARSVIAQELGVLVLIKRGVTVFTASGENLTVTDDPGRVMMRQVAGSFAEYEKSRLVQKLRDARDRKRVEKGRCEGRKPPSPELVERAKSLRRKRPKAGQRTYKEVAHQLAAEGYTVMGKDGNPTDRPYSTEGVRLLLNR